MARTGRRFPSRPLLGQRQALAVPVAAAAPPLPKQIVQDQAAFAWRRQQHRGRVVQNRWSGYQWAGLAPVTPLPRQVVVDDAWQVDSRRSPARKSLVIQNRWPGYQWVGLPPVNPTPKQVVQDQAAVEAPRLKRRSGEVIAPPVQLAAASGTTPPPFTGPLPKQLVQDSAALETARLEHRRGSVVAPGVQLAATAGAAPPPFSGPLPRQVVVTMRMATPRQARSGHIIQPRTLQAPVAPPRPVTIDLCPATTPRRARGGHIIVGRPVALPATRPRPSVIQRAAQNPRGRRGGIWQEGPQMGVFGSVTPPPTTTSTHALYAYPSVTATSAEAQSGATGYLSGSSNSTPLPPSPGLAPNPGLAPQSDESIILNPVAAEPQTGACGLVTAGASGTVRI